MLQNASKCFKMLQNASNAMGETFLYITSPGARPPGRARYLLVVVEVEFVKRRSNEQDLGRLVQSRDEDAVKINISVSNAPRFEMQ